MATTSTLVQQKLDQAVEILNEQDVDVWLTYVRETMLTKDPCLDLIAGVYSAWTGAFLVSATGERIAIVGRFDVPSVEGTGAFEVIGYDESIRPALEETVTRLDPHSIALNYSGSDSAADGLTHGLWLELQEVFEGTPFADRFQSSEAVVGALRGRKSPEEVARIRAATRETEEIFDIVTHALAPALSELEIADLVHAEVARRGLGYAWGRDHCPAVDAGPEKDVGHSPPGELRTRRGELLHVDFGVCRDDYCSDLQRMWYFLDDGEAEPPEDVRRAFDAVWAAMDAGISVLRPGAAGWEVDAAARATLVDAGYPEPMHALGHGLGRSAHDRGHDSRAPLGPVRGVPARDRRGGERLHRRVRDAGSRAWLHRPRGGSPRHRGRSRMALDSAARALVGVVNRQVPLVLVAALLVTATPAAAAPSRPDARTQLGILGDPGRFQQLTGQRSAVLHSFIGWDQPQTIPKLLGQLAPLPMLAIKTGPFITPLDIAQGRGDGFLLALNSALAGFGQRVYIRPMPEMNGHWNEYSAFEKSGASRGPRYSTAAFRRAFARIALIVRGGSAKKLNPKLQRLGGPPIGGDLRVTQARIVWNPQGYGAPDIPANAPAAYYPGDAYVDVVANDLYDQRFNAAWEANEQLYAAHRSKPFAIAEWGLWGVDDPPFVERMAAFVRSHGRIELLAYFNSKPGSLWDLGSKPRSRAAYRRVITPLGR